MSTEWGNFIAALEHRGRTFTKIIHATDRRSVILAAGFSDPIDVAVIETEWQARAGKPSSSGAQSPAQSSGIGSPISRSALQAYDSTLLSKAPEEIQDNVMAAELLAALVGQTGSFIVATHEGLQTSMDVPPSIRSVVQPILPIAESFRSLSFVEQAEYCGQSLVSMALGEVVSEVCAAYVNQVAALAKWTVTRVMPLVAVVAEAQRIGQHIIRLRQVVPDVHVRDSSLQGGRLLNHLHEQLVRSAGNKEDERLISLLLRRAAVPYLAILRQWMFEGVLNDPCGEFFIAENRRPAPAMGVSTTSTAFGGTSGFFHDVEGDAAAFDKRFVLNKAMIPAFLLSQGRVSKMILFAGKYCCMLRECDAAMPNFPNKDHPIVWTNADDLHQLVQESYDKASKAVMALLFDHRNDLRGHLVSLKNYFFHDRGDWLVDFLDSADELLHKSPVQIKMHTVKVLLQTSIAKSCRLDPYHGLIGCSFADSTIEQYIQMSLKAEGQPARGSGRLSTAKVETRRCIELLQLEADLKWPVTQILDPLSIKHMNVVFRLLMWVKVVERALNRSWRHADNTRAHSIRHQMVQFIRQFQFYAAHFVIEPLWGKMMAKIAQAESVLVVAAALQEFYEELRHGLVLSSTQRFRQFGKLLDLMNRFADIGRNAVGHVTPQQLSATILSVGETFLKVLSELGNPTGPDYHRLVPLLTWIDFSRFYERRNVYRVQHGAASQAEAAEVSSRTATAAQRDQQPTSREQSAS
jgi:gamma-tubulin complex component 2